MGRRSRIIWLAKVLGSAATIAFGTSAVTVGLGTGMLLGVAAATPFVPENTGAKPLRATAHERGPRPGIAHNPFCPDCSPLSVVAAPAHDASELPLLLLGTMLAEDADRSRAIIIDTDAQLLGPFETHEQVRAEVTIERIEDGRVLLKNGERLEYLHVGAPPEAPSPAAIPTPPKPVAGITGADEAVDCQGHACTIERAFVDRLLADPGQLVTQARVSPAMRDGAPFGFRFRGIRSGSLPKLLGLRNGDVVTAVNGHRLETIDDAMTAYRTLRRAKHLSVRLERKGEAITKEVAIE